MLMRRTLSHDPLALDPNCIHIVDALVFNASMYHLVASDDDDFNAVLPSWGIREAYVGPANTLAQVSIPMHPSALPARIALLLTVLCPSHPRCLCKP
jgi:hypothetical protein